MARKTKTEHREKVKNAEPVDIGGRLYRAKRRTVYTHTNAGCDVRAVHTAFVCLTRNPDGSRSSLTEVSVTATGSPDAVRAYFDIAPRAVFSADGCTGSHTFTL